MNSKKTGPIMSSEKICSNSRGSPPSVLPVGKIGLERNLERLPVPGPYPGHVGLEFLSKGDSALENNARSVAFLDRFSYNFV